MLRNAFLSGGVALALSLGGAMDALAQKTTLNVGLASADAGILDPHMNSATTCSSSSTVSCA
jgi:hypothetical protein